MKGEARPEICPVDRFQRRTGGAPDWLCQWPTGAWSMRLVPTAARSVVLTRLVFNPRHRARTNGAFNGSISSMKASLSSMLAMSGCQVSPQTLRRSATSGRRISLASSVFYG